VIFLRLAARNVLRNARRSAITVLAISVGMVALLFLWAFIDGVNGQMIDNSTRYLSGHLQVHLKGYHDDQSLDRMLGDAAQVVPRVAQVAPAAAVSRRLEGSALASLADKSRGVRVLGVDPQAEGRVTTLDRTIEEGRFLQPGDRDAVVVGSRIAEALGAKVGSELVLVTQASDGSVGAARYRIQGIFRTRMDMLDGSYVLMTLPAAQDLYATGESVTTVVARLPDRAQVPAVKAQLQALLGPGIEVLDWAQLLPSVVQSVAFHEVTGYVLLLVLFVVVAVGITNTVLMAVMERTREFGVMMALGTTQAQLTRVVFFEACLLGLAGLLLGAAAGLALVQYYASQGMDFGRYVRAMETMQGLTSVIYPLPSADRSGAIALVVFAVSIVAALYPAWRAARLVPIAAIRGLPSERSGARAARRAASARPASTLHLPILLKVAARGIGRNPQRSVLTVAASAIGVGAFVFLTGFVDGYLVQLVENSTGYVTGHLQVQHPRFRIEMEPTNSLGGAELLLGRLRAVPEVAAATPRIQSMALANSASQSQNFTLVGIVPESERQVTFMHRAVRSGRMLQPGADQEIVLGDRLAEKLGLRLGEKLVVMAQAADGSVGSAAYRVTGFFDTGSDAFDAMLGYVTLDGAQNLLGMQGRVSLIAVRLKDRERLPEALKALEGLVPSGTSEVVTWRNLLPEVDQMIEYVRVILSLVTGIVLAVVAIGVMNTLMMSVMERTRELGIMMALGTRPRAIVTLVLYESLVLALVGILAGLALGLPVVQYLGVRGLDLSRYASGLQSIPGLTGIIYPVFIPANLVRRARTAGPERSRRLVSRLAGRTPATGGCDPACVSCDGWRALAWQRWRRMCPRSRPMSSRTALSSPGTTRTWRCIPPRMWGQRRTTAWTPIGCDSNGRGSCDPRSALKSSTTTKC
jgi:putative ABC transport system permease protein